MSETEGSLIRYNATLANTEDLREKFLKKLEKTCNVSESARAVGVSRSTVYYWRNKWETFRREWDEAEAAAVDRLREKAFKVALEQESKSLAAQVSMIKFLLKAHDPDRYGDKTASELIAVETDAETGQARVVIGRYAPGVLDGLLDDSPLEEDEAEDD